MSRQEKQIDALGGDVLYIEADLTSSTPSPLVRIISRTGSFEKVRAEDSVDRKDCWHCWRLDELNDGLSSDSSKDTIP